MMSLSSGGGGAGPCTLLPSSSESLLGRLEHIDLRLRQLEEKQRLIPESSYFTADLLARGPGVLQQPCKSLSSALHEVHLKGTLMDRLHLLESRICQLSFDLDKSTGGMSSSSAVRLTTDEERWVQSKAAPDKKQQGVAAPCSISSKLVVGAPKRTGDLFQRGARELQGQKSKIKAKESKDGIDAEKRANTMRRNEKRRLERTQIYRRWFPVGC